MATNPKAPLKAADWQCPSLESVKMEWKEELPCFKVRLGPSLLIWA
jgi:hypothetical protein